ncbi:YezD family protein [Paenibacillus sp. GSMTC-2017]|uniref:YezD family protein n=1 Tax=Paenibacillus sp. GSMTC-2017 TaxID=2794350 RepID=UPI0018D848FA|nr:YezD family protein [Paenibacillus sp. GSMTC-2017]MBH5317430.1 YezD family protein [Paenibacillus sp. GSMTC-2017]
MSHVVQSTDEWVKRIKEKVTGLEYGTVQITVHNGQIVQIDKTERSRYDVVKSSPTVKNRGK